VEQLNHVYKYGNKFRILVNKIIERIEKLLCKTLLLAHQALGITTDSTRLQLPSLRISFTLNSKPFSLINPFLLSLFGPTPVSFVAP